MKNNYIVTINNISDIEKLKSLGITNYAFPLKGFCVGMPNTFLSEEIKENSYVFINRILDNKGIDELRKELNNIKNIKGIIFDDLGILELIKNMDVEKILYLSHFNTNSVSINLYLDYVDTVILSTDITKDEIEYIIKNTKKEISLFTFGYIGVMYSRRHLIKNYSEFHNIEYKNPLVIENDQKEFLVYENEFGTYFYYNKIFNGKDILELPVKYNFINSAFLSVSNIEDFLNNKKIDNSDTGFLYQETIYKVKDDSNV